MGNVLRNPVTTKEGLEGEAHGLRFAMSAMQGYRIEMEDAHVCESQLPFLPDCALFTVFDGHGGKTVANMGQALQVKAMQRTPAFKSGNRSAAMLGEMMRQSFYELDKEMRAVPQLNSGEDESGSTATSILITPTHFVIANCGDSRTVVYAGGKVKYSTVDHKPDSDSERERIYYAGGFVEAGRVNGNLAVSRALGDFNFKQRGDLLDNQQQVVAEADVAIIPRQDEDEFVIVACDGIWDVMTNEQAYTFVANQLKAGFSPKETCERMLEECLALDSKDNMTIILVLCPSAPVAVPGFTAPPLTPRPLEDVEGQPGYQGILYYGTSVAYETPGFWHPMNFAQLIATLRARGVAHSSGYTFAVANEVESTASARHGHIHELKPEEPSRDNGGDDEEDNDDDDYDEDRGCARMYASGPMHQHVVYDDGVSDDDDEEHSPRKSSSHDHDEATTTKMIPVTGPTDPEAPHQREQDFSAKEKAALELSSARLSESTPVRGHSTQQAPEQS